jgi:hypothetical protein
MSYLRFFILACLGGFFGWAFPVSADAVAQTRVQVNSRPISAFDRDDPQRRMFGTLEFRGGLELSSGDPRFGGFSALRLQSDGEHFLALSDRALWLRGCIVYNGDRPEGLADAEIAPVTGPDGKHAANWDTESIAVNRDLLFLGVEDFDRIPKFSFDTETFPVFLGLIPFPPARNLPRNKGLEALAVIPRNIPFGGILLAFSEQGLDKSGNLLAYMIQGADIKQFTVKRSESYDITDATLLPDGDVLILERKYGILAGPSMRLRRIHTADIKPDVLVDGPVVMEADMQFQIDNMEALSVHCSADGETVLTLMSDDNYSRIQRTLLLQFAYRE